MNATPFRARARLLTLAALASSGLTFALAACGDDGAPAPHATSTPDAAPDAVVDGGHDAPVQPDAPLQSEAGDSSDGGADVPEVGADADANALQGDYTSIVALDDCSGALVRFTGSKPTDHAMVLTNGHCYEGGLLASGEVIVGGASSRQFSLLDTKGKALGTLTASSILYATMTGTDFLLYQLTTTYEDIDQQYGTRGLTIANHRGDVGEPITIPSGYWLVTYNCAIDGFVYELDEAVWTWHESIRYRQPGCEVIHGTSGSPILDPITKEIIGINNTGNDDGERCTLNNPCEVAPDGGVTVTKGASYGQELYGIYTCLTGTNEIDLSLPGCTLAKPEPDGGHPDSGPDVGPPDAPAGDSAVTDAGDAGTVIER
jgi:hypothetical protein